MDYAGIDWGLIHVDRVLGQEVAFLADCVRRYPDRLRSMAPVDEPAIRTEPERVAADLETAIRVHGLHAIKFIPEYAYRSGARDWLDGPFRTFWDAASTLGVPVFLTLGAAPGHDGEQAGYRAELANVRRFQARYPDRHREPHARIPVAVVSSMGVGSACRTGCGSRSKDPRLHLEVKLPSCLGDVFPSIRIAEVWPTPGGAAASHRRGPRLLWGSDMPFQDRFCT